MGRALFLPPYFITCVHVYGHALSCVDGSDGGSLSKRGVAPMARCLYPFYTYTLIHLYKNTEICINASY